jgi:hypothetical protein
MRYVSKNVPNRYPNKEDQKSSAENKGQRRKAHKKS